MSQRELKRQFGAVTPIVHAESDFRSPVRYDDVVTVRADDRGWMKTPRPSRAGKDAAPAVQRARVGATPPRRGIQSVEIGLRVLTALAAETQPSTLGAVAGRAGLSASQAHRYLASLIASGMARQTSSTGRYDLGPAAIQIGLAALARTDLFAEADRAIADFTRETGRTTMLTAMGPHGPTIVRWHSGRTPVVTSLAVGSVLPLIGSATGHAFAAFMDRDELAGAIDRLAPRPLLTKAWIRRMCGAVRSEMSASVDETFIPGLRATAVPILDLQGRTALVATVIASPAFARKDDASIGRRLKTVCSSLSMTMVRLSKVL